MKKIIHRYTLFFIFSMFSHLGFTQDMSFFDWYKSNSEELSYSKEVSEFTYAVEYIPVELNVLKELKNKNEYSKKEIKVLYNKYKGVWEFNFKISTNKFRDLLAAISIDQNEYNDRLFYLIDQIGNDFTLVTKTGELKPLKCSFENNYGSAPFITLHLVFDFKTGNEFKQFVYLDSFFGCGNLVYDISTINKLNIPQIK